MQNKLLLIIILFTLQLHSQCWKSVATGPHHTLGLQEDGTLWCWGNNWHLTLGTESTASTASITKINNDTDWDFITAGVYQSMAIKTDGTLWVWGANYTGNLGNGTTTGIQLPTQLGTDSDWVLVSCRDKHTAAIKSDGTLWTWGSNSYLQLGVGDYASHLTPTRVGTDSDWKTVSTGLYCTMAIRTDGTLWVWGTNAEGIFGNGENPYFGQPNYFSILPMQVGTASDWVSISVGANYAAGIKADGTLWTWGQNSQGQLGDGTTQEKLFPQQLGTDLWSTVSCGINSSVYFCGGIKSDGTIWTWGSNQFGQLGCGSVVPSSIPVEVTIDPEKYHYTNADLTSAALSNEGDLYMWGNNASGQLGDGTFNSTPYVSPIPVYCNALGVDRSEQKEFGVFPNPVSNYLRIYNPGNFEINNIAVIDMMGKKIFDGGYDNAIDIAAAAPGIYTIEIKSGSKICYTKLVKE